MKKRQLGLIEQRKHRVLRRVDVNSLLTELGLSHVKTGERNTTASCPFHKDARPSFGMHNDTTAWNCFSCGENGADAVSLVSKVQEVSQEEAVLWLDAKFGISREEVWSVSIPEYEYIQATDLPPKVLSEASRQQFYDLYFPLEAGIKDKRLITSPNKLKRFDVRYDKVLNRIVFPIRNTRHQLIGFVGRAVDPNDQPRYYVYGDLSPGRTLFGAHVYDRKAPVLLVVEGPFDVWAAYKHNYPYAVGLFGSRATKHQIDLVKKLSRNWKKVVIALDNDFAGNHGAHYLYQAIRGECEVYFVTYPPEHKDLGGMDSKAFYNTIRSMKPVLENKVKEIPEYD